MHVIFRLQITLLCMSVTIFVHSEFVQQPVGVSEKHDINKLTISSIKGQDFIFCHYSCYVCQKSVVVVTNVSRDCGKLWPFCRYVQVSSSLQQLYIGAEDSRNKRCDVRRSSPVCNRTDTGLIPCYETQDFWQTQWYRETFVCRVLLFYPLSIIS